MFGLVFSTIFVLIAPVPLFFYAPAIVSLTFRMPLLTCLWIAAACGLFLDLLSPYSLFGLHAIVYTLTTALLYPLKTKLPLETALFSLAATLLTAVLLLISGEPIVPTPAWIATDLIILPLSDALYGSIAFIAIPALFSRNKKPQAYRMPRPK